MKPYNFDISVYNKLQESLFDIFDNTENEEDINDDCIQEITSADISILYKLNELYNKQQGNKKYGILQPIKFSKITHKTINGIDYKLITEIESLPSYICITAKHIKKYSGIIHIISSQELLNYILQEHIILQTKYTIKEDADNYNYATCTVIFDSVTVPQEYFNSILLFKDIYPECLLGITYYFNNTSIDIQGLQDILNVEYIYIYDLYFNNGFKQNKKVILQINRGVNITIENEKELKTLNIIYKSISYYNNASLYIKKCNSIENLSIKEISEKITLKKLRIQSCPNINKDTLILPCHNTMQYIQELNANKRAAKDITFRGDIVEWFYRYSEKGSFYKYPKHYIYYMYWKKDE